MEQYNDEIELKDILIKLSDYTAYLLKKKVVILSVSFLFLIIGIFISYFSEIKYNAKLTFVVEEKSGSNDLGSMSGIASQFGFDLGGNSSSAFSQQNILELLKSRGVIVSALLQNAKVNSKNDLLIEHYIQINKIEYLWETNENLYPCQDNDSISGNIWTDIITEKLVVVSSDESSIINLSYISENDEFAKMFVETLIEQMSKMYIVHQTAQANNTLGFLNNRADSVFMELEVAEEEFARVKDINQRIVKASGRLKEMQLMRRVEVLNAMYLEIVKSLELSKITLLNQTPIIQIIDKPILPLDKESNSKILFGLLGAFLGGLLSLGYFILRKLFKDALSE